MPRGGNQPKHRKIYGAPIERDRSLWFYIERTIALCTGTSGFGMKRASEDWQRQNIFKTIWGDGKTQLPPGIYATKDKMTGEMDALRVSLPTIACKDLIYLYLGDYH